MENNLNEMYKNLKDFMSKDTQELIMGIKSGNENLDQLIKEFLKNRNKKEVNISKIYSAKYIWGLSLVDLSELDLSNVPIEVLMRIPFSTETKWPSKDKLPKGFEPDKLIINATSFKGLGVDELHKQKIQGQGIKIAYIDKPFDTTHKEFEGSKIEYNNLDINNNYDFHGYSVVSRILGQNIGVSPQAEMIYYACGMTDKYETYIENYIYTELKALKDIIRRVDSGEKIDIIGISASIEGQIKHIQDEGAKQKFMETWSSCLSKLKTFELPLIDADVFFDSGFNYACKVNPLKDNEDLNNFAFAMNVKDSICVVEADKCVPMPFTNGGYKYENNLGCASWSIPQVVGLYSLAKQTNSNLTFEEFIQISHKTAKENLNGTKLIDSIELIKEAEYRKENESVLAID